MCEAPQLVDICLACLTRAIAEGVCQFQRSRLGGGPFGPMTGPDVCKRRQRPCLTGEGDGCRGRRCLALAHVVLLFSAANMQRTGSCLHGAGSSARTVEAGGLRVGARGEPWGRTALTRGRSEGSTVRGPLGEGHDGDSSVICIESR